VSCEERWKLYRRLRWEAFGGWLLGAYMGRFPGDLAHLVYLLFGVEMPLWLYYALLSVSAILAFSLLIFTWGRLAEFPCPRCGIAFRYAGGVPRWWQFIERSSRFSPFARKCQNCGLRKWSCEGVVAGE